MKKYILSLLLVVLLIVPFVGQAATLAQLQAQLARIMAQISALQNNRPAPICQFTHDLSLGDGENDGLTREVSALQKVLISGGFLNIKKPTGWFGKMTMGAVKQWQDANPNNLTVTGAINANDRVVLCGGNNKPGCRVAVTCPYGQRPVMDKYENNCPVYRCVANSDKNITLAITGPADLAGLTGQYYNKSFSVNQSATIGANRIFSWSVINGSLPPGLKLISLTNDINKYNINISGIPTNYGDFPFALVATDNLGNRGSVNLKIFIGSISLPICAQDVYLCPDTGITVSRRGSDCQFVCPFATTTTPVSTSDFTSSTISLVGNMIANIIGDSTGNGQIDTLDANTVMDIYLGRLPIGQVSCLCCADTDINRQITPNDSLLIHNYLLNKVDGKQRPIGQVGATCAKEVKGDVDGNRKINEQDAQLIFDIYMSRVITLQTLSMCGADTNGDSQITPADALLVYNYVLNQTTDKKDRDIGKISQQCL